MSNKSQMAHQFSQVPKAEIQRSSFDRSHSLKTTLSSGYLVPIFCDEALPGDSFNLKMTALARIATPIFPFMDNVFVDTFFFAVPNRILWDNWEKFNGAQTDPGDSTDYTVPILGTHVGFGNESIHDYFGIPTNVAIDANNTINALHHRAYNLIYNEWFRDQNLQDSVPVITDDGPDNTNNYALLRRGKRHDYFTSSLPFSQKGPGVELPLGGTAPIHTDAADDTNLSIYSTTNSKDVPLVSSTAFLQQNGLTASSADNLYADLTQATSVTINSLRQAFQIQRMYERDARGGSRYTEIILSHFLVSSPDSRLQRPEYLGGGSVPLNVQTVPQTSESTAETPQGNLAAFGTATLHNHGFNKSFSEHMVIIGLMSIRADLTYQQGLDRMWSRQTRFDYFWPALAHLGEQSVKNREIFMQATGADDQTFGYQERYAEYRYKNSMITGKFRSNDPQTLDAWHLAQDFATLPTLSADFIEDNPPIDRVIAVPSEPQFLLDCYFSMRCARPMPLYGVPGDVDRF